MPIPEGLFFFFCFFFFGSAWVLVGQSQVGVYIIYTPHHSAFLIILTLFWSSKYKKAHDI